MPINEWCYCWAQPFVEKKELNRLEVREKDDLLTCKVFHKCSSARIEPLHFKVSFNMKRYTCVVLEF